MTLRNACGQRAVALALSHLGLDAPSARAVHARFPPDTPLALLGTTPRRVAEAARGFGADAREIAARAPDAAATIARALARRDAVVAVRVDARRLGGPWGWHWVVALDADATGVTLGNMARSRGGSTGPRRRVPWRDLEAALAPRWRLRGVVIARPRNEAGLTSEVKAPETLTLA